MPSIREFIITARNNKTKNRQEAKKRSQLLKVVMPHLSGPHGDNLAGALYNKDFDLFQKLWKNTSDSVIENVQASIKKSD